MLSRAGDLDATETAGPMTSSERCRAGPGCAQVARLHAEPHLAYASARPNRSGRLSIGLSARPVPLAGPPTASEHVALAHLHAPGQRPLFGRIERRSAVSLSHGRAQINSFVWRAV